jgi:hypothetical protein
MFMTETSNHVTLTAPMISDEGLILDGPTELTALRDIAAHYGAIAQDRDGGAMRDGALALAKYIDERLADTRAGQMHPSVARPIGPLSVEDRKMLRGIGRKYSARPPAGAPTAIVTYAARLALIES